MTAHDSSPTARPAVPRSPDLADALKLILEALEGPTGELGEVLAASMIRDPGRDRAHVTALVRSAGRDGVNIHRGIVGPDWSHGSAGRLALRWRPSQFVADTGVAAAAAAIMDTPKNVTP